MKDEFAEHIDKLLGEVERIIESNQLPPESAYSLEETVEEFAAMTEELKTAEEELEQRNEMLHATHQRLEEERARYQALFRAAPVAYLVTTAQGVIKEANRAAARLLNIPHRFLPGRPLLTHVPREEYATFTQLRTLEVRASEPRAEMQLQPLGGGPRHVLVTVSPISDLTTEPAELLWILQDVTERHRAEDAVRQTRDTLQGVLAAAPAGIIVADEEGRILMTNDFARYLFGGAVTGDAHGPEGGYEAHTSGGHPLRPKELPLSLALKGQTVTNQEIVVKRADGVQFTILASATPLRDEGGGTRGAVTVFQDITQRKVAEEALRQSEEELRRLHAEVERHAEELEELVAERTAELRAQYARLEAVLRTTTDGFIVTNPSGEILHINPVAEMWMDEVLAPEEARRLREAIYDLAGRAESRPDRILEFTDLDLQLKAAPLQDLGEEGSWVVVAMHDVSPFKTLERAKTQFITDVSHELRTPVTTMKLYTELLAQSEEGARDKYLRALQQESERLGRMIQGILSFSRLDGGEVELEEEVVDLEGVAASVVKEHRVMAEEEGVALHFTALDSLSLRADPEKIERVIRNLVNNAVRYTEAGGHITVEVRAREKDTKRWATVSVRDTGVGIPAEELPHIFERFFRGETSREGQIPGTGLGLAIVKKLVELHGGHVEVESELGEGTTFTVWLPHEGRVRSAKGSEQESPLES